MGCCCSKKNLQVNIIDAIAEGNDFDYLRPKRIIFFLKIDSVYDVPQLEIFFVTGTLTVLGFDQKLKKLLNMS